MNTYHKTKNIPVITDMGRSIKYGGNDFHFEMGSDTQVFYSCSITFKGKFYVFGGVNEKKQISVIDDCMLKRVGSLPFEFDLGACTNVNDFEFYLCFDYNNIKTCRKSSDPFGPFTTIADSTGTHKATRIANDGGLVKLKIY